MEILQIRYFMAVMEHKNFTKAARATFTSQSNISKQIVQMEEELETQLFFRTNTGVDTTPAAEHLYNGLKVLLPELDSLMETTREIGMHSEKTMLRLGLCESMDLERIIPDFSTRFHKENPDTQLSIETYPFMELLKTLSLRELDCVFYFSVLKAEVPALKRMPVSRGVPMIYYSGKHWLSGKCGLCVDDFSEETFVRSTNKCESFDQYEVLPFLPKKIIEANSLNAAFQYIETGEAVGVFGPSQNRLGKESIRTIPIQTTTLVGTDALWMSDNMNPALPHFLQFLKLCESSNEHYGSK